ncbi:MAG TPA: NUDIX hydrolase [Candidatus Thermoplasmatota archaeon]|jgi:ADP-ribose pyrophosphatase YjhB (NUDIX family)|nr:NUDIX hydrolase [Candidatus Thermoplasmatota archaeon]
MAASGEPAYFLDHDGRVFLVRDGAGWRLPTKAEVPFRFAEKHRASIQGRVVVFGGPLEKHLRTEWPWKDDLYARDDVEPLARAAANMTQPRVVAKGAFLRGGDVLLIKDKVGFYAGRWNLPGGYLDYGEGPEACVVREAGEELGVKAEVTRLLRIDAQVVPTGLQFITFHYEGRLASDELQLKPDEIAAAQWVALADAAREVASVHSRAALEQLLKEARRA